MNEKKAGRNSYASLGVQTLVSGVIMYLVMFAMIDDLGSFYNNLNTLYMALMMTAPMAALMILAMPAMFPSTRINAALLTLFTIIFFGSFALIRTQASIGDTAFLRSMIPHHSGAVLMCKEATLEDERVARLCRTIIASQRAEIAEMKAMLTARE